MMKKITLLLFLLTASIGFAQPTTDAPTPTNDAADVISIYSDVYTDVATNYNPFWNQSGSVNTTYDPTGGGTNFVMAYTNFNYQGTDIATQNAAAMEFLHVDIWTANATDVKVSPINNGSGAGEFLVPVTLVTGSWSSVDIPKSAFTGMTWDSVYQLKFDGQAGTNPSDIYLDNIYFWKAPVDPNTDATLNDLQVDGSTINGFSGAITDYTYEVPTGTTVVPQITLATPTEEGLGATASITQATAIPGDATVLVTAANGTDTETYTVSIAAVGPPTAAPTPPARPVADVISLYSDAYTDVASNFDAGWCGGGSVSEVMIDGNATQKYLNNACQGIVLDTGVDASTFTNLHVDVYIQAGTDLTSAVFNLKYVNQPGGAALEINLNVASSPALVAGTWMQIDIPVDLSTFTGFKEFGITSNLNGKVWYDNLYTHKNTLGLDDLESASFNVYPNPTENVWNIKTNNTSINSVQVFDMLGQEVITLNPNAEEVKIDGSTLNTGLYFARIESLNGIKTIKLIRK